MSLKGKKIVVTGASKGLGLGIVKRLANEGAEIIAHYNTGDISEALRAAQDCGVPFTAFQADLSNTAETYDLAHKIIQCGDIYGLVNNAGVCVFEDFFDITAESFDFTFGVNIKSAFILTQVIAKQMVQKHIRGRIVNFSSIAAESGSATQVHYGAAKGAVSSFTRAAAAALGQYGITVNAILPGPVPTKHNSDFLKDEAVRADILKKIPLGEYGTPENIADAVAYLLGENANWTTGMLMPVDGGFLA
jgi:NAD(P)-dependent dehydrogenase (short-subunit alcohol dehydrogenase family)